jgi:beta-fructofuranosidase
MVCGAALDNKGKILLFKSENLIDWSFVNVLYENTDYISTPECPDLFYLDGKWVLMFSAMGVKTKTSVFLIGSFDGESFVVEKKRFCEYGDHFYAPQTFLDEKGRRIMIGWMYSWAKQPNKDDDSAGSLSIPRELHIVDDILTAFPVDEAKHLLKNDSEHVTINEGVIRISYNGEVIAEYDTNKIEEIDRIEKIDILTDTKSVEVFVNNGKMNFSRLLV